MDSMSSVEMLSSEPPATPSITTRGELPPLMEVAPRIWNDELPPSAATSMFSPATFPTSSCMGSPAGALLKSSELTLTIEEEISFLLSEPYPTTTVSSIISESNSRVTVEVPNVPAC